MRNIVKIILATTLFMFIGCSGGGKSTQTSEAIPLAVGEEVVVQEGDKLITNEDTVINVVHEVDSPIKRVTLVSGTAELLRGDYEITGG